MPTAVWKYELPFEDNSDLLMPQGARLLSVGIQDHAPVLWAQVNVNAPKVLRRVAMVGTGHERDDLNGCPFVDTVQFVGGTLVFHVFDLGEVHNNLSA